VRAQFVWPLALVAGAAVAARAAVPLPFTAVPVSLQGLAVLLTGGIFGAGVGAGAMLLYLALGAFGAPVFAGGTGGLSHLFGSTGGYLFAFPLAAFATGRSLSSVMSGLAPVAWSDLAKVLIATLVLWPAAGALRPRA